MRDYTGKALLTILLILVLFLFWNLQQGFRIDRIEEKYSGQAEVVYVSNNITEPNEYVIQWKSIVTDTNGCGTKRCSWEKAIKICEELNSLQKPKTLIWHWPKRTGKIE